MKVIAVSVLAAVSASAMNLLINARSSSRPEETAIADVETEVDLLLAGSGSFLSGPTALQASFRDVKRHLIATFAGLHGSLRAAIATFDPVQIEAAVSARASLLKSRATLQADEIASRHADLTRELEGVEGDTLELAFVAAYDAAEAQAVAGTAS